MVRCYLYCSLFHLMSLNSKSFLDQFQLSSSSQKQESPSCFNSLYKLFFLSRGKRILYFLYLAGSGIRPSKDTVKDGYLLAFQVCSPINYLVVVFQCAWCCLAIIREANAFSISMLCLVTFEIKVFLLFLVVIV